PRREPFAPLGRRAIQTVQQEQSAAASRSQLVQLDFDPAAAQSHHESRKSRIAAAVGLGHSMWAKWPAPSMVQRGSCRTYPSLTSSPLGGSGPRVSSSEPMMASIGILTPA